MVAAQQLLLCCRERTSSSRSTLWRNLDRESHFTDTDPAFAASSGEATKNRLLWRSRQKAARHTLKRLSHGQLIECLFSPLPKLSPSISTCCTWRCHGGGGSRHRRSPAAFPWFRINGFGSAMRLRMARLRLKPLRC